MKSKLDDWNHEIDELEKNLAKARKTATKEIQSRLSQARGQCAVVRQKVQEIRTSDKPWESLKDDAEHVWEVLKKSVNYFRSQL